MVRNKLNTTVWRVSYLKIWLNEMVVVHTLLDISSSILFILSSESAEKFIGYQQDHGRRI